MILCDFKCRRCGFTEEVWCSRSPRTIKYKCECGGKITWKPSIGRIDAFEPRKDEQSGLTLTSHHQLDKWAKENKKEIVSKKDFESRLGTTSTEDRINRGTPAIREAVKKAHYRLRHGYVDHPKLEKDKLPKHDSTGFIPESS